MNGVLLSTPGARVDVAYWVDVNGSLWLFGGQGYGIDGSFGVLGDLWRFDWITRTWVPVALSGSVNSSGVYGTKGVAASNYPAGRLGAMGWSDFSGNAIWIFGGRKTSLSSSSLNDLWRYDGTDWVWMAGSSSAGASGVYGTKGTLATTNVPGARTWSTSWKGSDGSLWFFGGTAVDSAGSTNYINDIWKISR